MKTFYLTIICYRYLKTRCGVIKLNCSKNRMTIDFSCYILCLKKQFHCKYFTSKVKNKAIVSFDPPMLQCNMYNQLAAHHPAKPISLHKSLSSMIAPEATVRSIEFIIIITYTIAVKTPSVLLANSAPLIAALWPTLRVIFRQCNRQLWANLESSVASLESLTLNYFKMTLNSHVQKGIWFTSIGKCELKIHNGSEFCTRPEQTSLRNLIYSEFLMWPTKLSIDCKWTSKLISKDHSCSKCLGLILHHFLEQWMRKMKSKVYW